MSPNDERNLRRAMGYADELSEMIAERGITREQILTDRFIQWALTTPIYNVGEFTSHVSKELRATHPEIPWSRVAGTRHRLVHDYDGTNWEIIADIALKDMPEYSHQIKALLAQG